MLVAAPRHDFDMLGARSRSRVTRGDNTGCSVLYGRRTAGITLHRLGDDYRTSPRTMQEEVAAALRSPLDFLAGPPALRRVGFKLRDGRYPAVRPAEPRKPG